MRRMQQVSLGGANTGRNVSGINELADACPPAAAVICATDSLSNGSRCDSFRPVCLIISRASSGWRGKRGTGLTGMLASDALVTRTGPESNDGLPTRKKFFFLFQVKTSRKLEETNTSFINRFHLMDGYLDHPSRMYLVFSSKVALSAPANEK